jgi:hypothetical protein
MFSPRATSDTLPPSRSAGWSALFLSAASPGMVVRYLERRRRAGEAVPDGLLLSDRAGESRTRALAGDSDAHAWMEASGAALSRAFPPTVTFLWSEPVSATTPLRWGFVSWKDGEENGRHEQALDPEQKRGFLGLARRPLPAPVRWAQRQGLPLGRVLGESGSRLAVPVIDYETVAKLDQKSLLVESSPRLYRFDLPPLLPTRTI